MDEDRQLTYTEQLAHERTAKQLALLRRRVYKTIEDVEQHILDWVDYAYESEMRGVSLVELNRRYGKATRQFGITPVNVLELLNNRHRIMAMQYRTATNRGTIIVSLKFQKALDDIYDEAKKDFMNSVDDCFEIQRKFTEAMKLRTIGEPG